MDIPPPPYSCEVIPKDLTIRIKLPGAEGGNNRKLITAASAELIEFKRLFWLIPPEPVSYMCAIASS